MMLSEIRRRIENMTHSPIGFVGTELDLNTALQRQPLADIECYVIPLKEQAGENQRSSGPVVQMITVTTGVVFVARTGQTSAERPQTDRLEQARSAIRDEILGWAPTGASSRLLQAGSEIIRVDPDALWWIDCYQSQVQRRSNPRNNK